MEMSPHKHIVTPEAVEQYLAAGAAPGCEVALSSQAMSESFALGHFSDEGSEAVTTDTLYDVASISKLFTTALILRLHEHGALSIDDRCADYLDNFKGSDIRLIDLLTHRVDFGVYLSEYRDKYPNEIGLRTALFNMKPPVATSPNVHYGNLEFVYLGKIIEDRTGRDLQTSMHELFRQLGLQHTSTGRDVATRRIRIPPTEVMDGKVISGITHDETARTLGGLAGNAGVFSTAEDLVRFGRAWLNGAIVTVPELVHKVFTDQDISGLKPLLAHSALRMCRAAQRGLCERQAGAGAG